MGYQTCYELKIKSFTRSKDLAVKHFLDSLAYTSKEIIADLRKYDDEASCAIDEYGQTANAWKWYEHEDSLKKISKRYPNRLFILNGKGEESGDVWVKYFKNGQMQLEKLKVVLPGFDPEKLK